MLLAWTVILLCVAAVVVRPAFLSRARTTPDSAPIVPSLAETASTQLELAARIAVGTKALAGSEQAKTNDLAARVDQAATGPTEQFRAIPVVAEFSGGQAALDRLDELERRFPLVRLRADADALRVIYRDGVDRLSAEQVERLVENHGWFGRLAVSYGRPADDPKRQAATGPAQRTIVVASMFAFLVLGAGLAGLALAIVAAVLWTQGQLSWAFRPPTPYVGGPLGEAFALYLLGWVGLSAVLGRLFPQAGLSLAFVLYTLIPLVLVYVRSRGVTWTEARDALGLHRGRGLLRETGAGVVGYLAGLPVLAIGLAVTLLLMKLTGATATHPVSEQGFGRPAQAVVLFLLAAVGAPLVEELMFRGALLGHLRSRLPWWAAAPIVSLIFAAIHPQGWAAIPVLSAIALVFAGMREWRGSLVAPIVGHAMNNGAIVLVMVGMLG